MRLFTAILFDKGVSDEILTRTEKLSQLCRGRFIPPQSMHITLSFIGETERVKEIMDAMDALRAPCFDYTIRGLGRFKRSDGDILWAGIDGSTAMKTTQRLLADELMSRGFCPEERQFKPHITLVRRAAISDDNYYTAKHIFCTGIAAHAKKISLMKSERKNGQMVYTEIYKRELL